MGSGLRITVLGRVAATFHGELLALGGRRQRAVLALLVLGRGGVVTAERLVESLWCDRPPPRAMGALQAYVSHLRRGLEPGQAARARSGFIVSEGGGYALRLPEDAVDAWCFERAVHSSALLGSGPGTPGNPADLRDTAAAEELRAALALWQGTALAEYDTEPWARPEAARLAELREVARERLLAARLECGENAALVPEIEALIAEDPLREERWRLLALTLYRARRQTDALGALRRARRTLAEELGVDPGPALRALEAGILARSPELDAADRTCARTPAPAPGSVPTPLRRPSGPAPDQLVDRERELAELTAVLAEERAGAVYVEGPAGIGKTRLLTEARRLAADRGALVLSARGTRREKEYAFGVVRQLMDQALSERGADLLTGPAAPAAPVFSDAGGPARPEGFAVLSALHHLVIGLGEERQLVLAIDDLQWCDSGSLHFLAYLAHRADETRVLLVATLRTGEPLDDDAGELMAELFHDPAAVRLVLAPLTAAGVARLVRERLGDEADHDFLAACHRTTSGNPLLLGELLRALQGDGVPPVADRVDTVTELGSRAVSSLVLARLAQLPPASVAAAQAIAVLGDGASLPAVAALLQRGEDETADSIAPLVRKEVIADRYPLGFVHPLVADSVYRDLPPGERQLRHERAARVLAASGAAAEQVAAHLLSAPLRGDPWVVQALRSAAGTAVGRGAADAARTYLSRALQEPPAPAERPGILLQLGLAEAATDGPAAVGHLREAYETDDDPVRRAVTARILAGTLVFTGVKGEATAFARRAVAAVPAELADERQALVALERISGYLHNLPPRTWRAGPVPSVTGTGPGARLLAAALAWEAFVYRPARGRAEAVRPARFALDDGVLLGTGVGPLWAVPGVVLHLAGENSDPAWAEGLAHAHDRGSVLLSHVVRLWRGYTQWCRGDLAAALASLAVATEQSDRWGTGPDSSYARHAFAIGVLVDRGEVADARRRFAEAEARLGDTYGARLLADAQAALLLAEERFTEALDVLDDTTHLQPVSGLTRWPSGPLRAQALTALGRTEEALAELRAELALARSWGAPALVARTLRLLASALGPGPAALTALREAETLLLPGLAELERARVLHALAGLLPPDQARTLLRRARTVAERCAAAGLVRDVDAALDQPGGCPP